MSPPPAAVDASARSNLAALTTTVEAVHRDVRQILDHALGRAKSHLTVDEVADEVGRAPYTVRTWVQQGRLKATRVHGTGPRGRLLIRREDFEDLLRID